MINLIGEPLIKFYSEASRRCRSAEGTLGWIKDMVSGGIMEHLISFVKLTDDVNSLIIIGLLYLLL